MKSTHSSTFVLLLSIFGLFFISSCSKDEKDPPSPSNKKSTTETQTTGGTFSADIDGVHWSAEELTVDLFSGNISVDGDSNDISIGMQIVGDAAEGVTYSAGGLENHLYYFEGIQNFKLVNGEIKVDIHNIENRYIEGGFSFVCANMNNNDTVRITNGSFAINYPKE